jgi:hypothetical protein
MDAETRGRKGLRRKSVCFYRLATWHPCVFALIFFDVSKIFQKPVGTAAMLIVEVLAPDRK